MVAQGSHKPQVAGSIPAGNAKEVNMTYEAIKIRLENAALQQFVEDDDE